MAILGFLLNFVQIYHFLSGSLFFLLSLPLNILYSVESAERLLMSLNEINVKMNKGPRSCLPAL